MAKQGLQPAPDLLQAQAGELTRITLPAHLLQQQQEAAGAAVEAACSNQHQLYSFSAQCDDQHGSSTATSSSSDGTHRAKATACMAAASEAVEAFERGKAAAAASVQASRLSAQMAVHSLQKQRVKAIAAGPSKAKETSNMVSGGCRHRTACSAHCCALRQDVVAFPKCTECLHMVVLLVLFEPTWVLPNLQCLVSSVLQDG